MCDGKSSVERTRKDGINELSLKMKDFGPGRASTNIFMDNERDGYGKKDFGSDAFYKANLLKLKRGQEVELDVSMDLSISVSFLRSILVLRFLSCISFLRQIYLFFV